MQRRLGVCVAITSVLVLGCGKPATNDEAAPLEFSAELGRSFELAATGLAVVAAEAPDSALRWATPGCELSYELRVSLDIELLDERTMPQSGLRIAGGWTARADGERMILRNGELGVAHIQSGIQRPGSIQAPATLAEIRLESDGQAWTEVDGPTALWSAFGSWMGLVLFYPALPESTPIGARVGWPLLVHGRGAGVRVEAERGTVELPEGYEHSEPESETIPARVELQRWIEVAGTRAAVLRSRFDLEDSSPFSGFDLIANLDADKTSEGQYVLLESGVLLHAELREQTRTTMRMGLSKTMKQLHTLHAEARLVHGCEGPVLPSFPDLRTPDERALELVVALRSHALARQAELLTSMLDPKLSAAHPEAARCLIATLERFGPRALGTPELPMDDRVQADEQLVRVRLRAHVAAKPEHGEPEPGESEPDDTAEVELSVRVEGGQARLSALELRRFGADEPLLRLDTEQTVISVAGCGASD